MILRSIKTSLSFSDCRNFEKTMNLLTLPKVKLLYNIVSNKLVNRNGYFIEFNKLVTSLLAYNTATMPLGNLVQSKFCLFYLSPYVFKKTKS